MDVVEPAMVMSADRPRAASPPKEVAPGARVSLRHRLEFAALRTVIALARRLPIGWVTGLGAAIVGLGGPWLRQHRRAMANLAIAFPEKSEAERHRIARAMWANMGRLFAETLILERIIAEPDRVEVADHAHWQRRLAEPGAALACTLHMGNWELAALPLVRFGQAMAGVYKPLENPLVDAWLARTRGPLYPGGLLGKGDSDDDAKSGHRTARQLIDLVRKNRCICFVCDHVDRRGTAIAFMGAEARFTTVPAMIARHVGARLWVGCCFRIGTESRFRMVIRELPVPDTGDRAGDALAITTAIFAQFEAWIREAPEQWMWWNTRWVKSDGSLSGKADL